MGVMNVFFKELERFRSAIMENEHNSIRAFKIHIIAGNDCRLLVISRIEDILL